MRTRRSKLIMLGAGGVLAAAVAVPAVAYAASAIDPTPTPSQSTEDPGRRGGGPHGGPFGEQPAALAEALGVSEEKLTEALRSLREQRRDGPRSDFAAALAEKLGLSPEKVTEALESVRAKADEARRAERTTRLKERLDKAVADGTLTQAEADAVRKAADAGVLWERPSR